MHTIGVRDLKAHLSECLKRVRAGQRLIVTDRGRSIATISPIDAPPSIDWVLAMVAEGRAAWDGGKPAGLQRRVRARGKPTSRMVLEDRR